MPTKSPLRLNPELDCGISENKTPAGRTAGAACDVVDTRSDIASKRIYITHAEPCKINSTHITQINARKRGAPACLLVTQITRGVSERSSWPLRVSSTTPRNAWLVGQVYRVEENPLADVLLGSTHQAPPLRKTSNEPFGLQEYLRLLCPWAS